MEISFSMAFFVTIQLAPGRAAGANSPLFTAHHGRSP